MGGHLVPLPRQTGRVLTVSGLADAYACQDVLNVTVGVSAGDSVDALENSWSRVGHVIAVADTGEAALASARHSAQLVDVRVG